MDGYDGCLRILFIFFYVKNLCCKTFVENKMFPRLFCTLIECVCVCVCVIYRCMCVNCMCACLLLLMTMVL